MPSHRPSKQGSQFTVGAVDLFCGAGGLTRGLLDEGIAVGAGIDLDNACRHPYETNNHAKFVEANVAELDVADVAELFPAGDIRLLAGCAPCQPFSTYTQGRDTRRDQKWGLLYEFARLIEGLEPELVTMENVPQVARHSVYNDFVKKLEGLGYFVASYKVFGPDYGIPQARTRLVLLASKFGPVSLIEPTHFPKTYKTVWQTIGHLAPIRAGEVSPEDPLHRSSSLSDLNLQRIRSSRPGGSWKDWDEHLVAACHKEESGATYPGVYGRMEWEKPSPTITTQFFGFGSGRFGHPEQDRALSLREGALLQTFPEDYEFIDPRRPMSLKQIGTMIGNAVPVRLGRVVGKSILRHLENHA